MCGMCVLFLCKFYEKDKYTEINLQKYDKWCIGTSFKGVGNTWRLLFTDGLKLDYCFVELMPY